MRILTPVPSLATADSPCNAIAEEMGMEFLKLLQERFGGCELKLPKRASVLADGHRLITTFGRADAERLCALIGGEQFYVPRGYRDFARLDQVRQELAAGTNTQDMAIKLGISARHIRRIKQQLRAIAVRGNRTRPAMMAAE